MLYRRAILLILIGIATSTLLHAQTIEVPQERENMFRIYLSVRHGGLDKLDEFKLKEPEQYYKELWYYCSSFYIKRNHYPEGYAFTEANVDVSRYELYRLPDKEAYVRVGPTCDAIVLLPLNQLLYKPDYIK